MAKIPVHSQQAKNPTSSSSEEEDPGPIAFDLPEEEGEKLRELGFSNPGRVPNERSGMPDLLIYGLVPHSGQRPDLGMVLGVAAELEALAMFIEGPLSITIEMMGRRLRVAVDLAKRMNPPPPPPPGAG